MKLTIGLLVSNRIQKLEKVLLSVKPLLDEGVAELICVDTVSETPGMTSDGSAELAAKYATRIIPFAWIKDFSAARNITLQNASGEWYLFIDDDEWFEDVMPILRFFKSGEYTHYRSASYTIRNFKDPEFTQWGDTTAVRLVKRTPDLQFTGRIHEYLNNVELPCKELDCVADHDGYVFLTDDDRKKHSERNVSLLEEELANNPGDFRLHAQMALELASVDNEKALSFVRDTLSKFALKKSDNMYQWLLSLQFPLLEALNIPATEAEKLFDELKKKNRLTETAELAMHYSLARINILFEDYAQAKKHIAKYEELTKVVLRDDKKRFSQDAVDFKKFYSKQYRDEIRNFDKQIGLVGTTAEKIDLLSRMPFEEFMEAIDNELAKTTNRFESEFFGRVLEYFEKESVVLYSYVLYRMTEEEIMAAVANGAGGKAIDELMSECVLTERRMYEALYRPEMLDGQHFNLLDERVKYNDVLTRFVRGGKKDFRLLLEAGKLRPSMALVMKAWLGAF